MTCSRFTSWSLPTEIDPDKTFNVVMGLEGYYDAATPPCSDFPNPDYIFSGIADVDADPGCGIPGETCRYQGWITNAPVDPGWTMTINQTLAFKTFYQDLTGLTDIPDVLHWKLATGPADPVAKEFTVTHETAVQEIRVIKPMGMLPWIALGAAAIGVTAVGIVSYKKWG